MYSGLAEPAEVEEGHRDEVGGLSDVLSMKVAGADELVLVHALLLVVDEGVVGSTVHFLLDHPLGLSDEFEAASQGFGEIQQRTHFFVLGPVLVQL